MKTQKITFIIVLLSFVFLGMTFLIGCTTLGISLDTDYGRITYELPEPKGTKK